jgi:hypothetical protein
MNVEAMGGTGLAARSPLIHSPADQPVETTDVEATPSQAGGQDDGSRAQDVAAVKENVTGSRVNPRDGMG